MKQVLSRFPKETTHGIFPKEREFYPYIEGGDEGDTTFCGIQTVENNLRRIHKKRN